MIYKITRGHESRTTNPPHLPRVTAARAADVAVRAIDRFRSFYVSRRCFENGSQIARTAVRAVDFFIAFIRHRRGDVVFLLARRAEQIVIRHVVLAPDIKFFRADKIFRPFFILSLSEIILHKFIFVDTPSSV